MSDNLTKLLEITARLDERTGAIQQDVAEIKVENQRRLDTHSQRLGDLEHSRAKARGVLWVLGGLISFVGGERLVEWLGRGQ